jgi:hypothetical protein
LYQRWVGDTAVLPPSGAWLTSFLVPNDEPDGLTIADGIRPLDASAGALAVEITLPSGERWLVIDNPSHPQPVVTDEIETDARFLMVQDSGTPPYVFGDRVSIVHFGSDRLELLAPSSIDGPISNPICDLETGQRCFLDAPSVGGAVLLFRWELSLALGVVAWLRLRSSSTRRCMRRT